MIFILRHSGIGIPYTNGKKLRISLIISPKPETPFWLSNKLVRGDTGDMRRLPCPLPIAAAVSQETAAAAAAASVSPWTYMGIGGDFDRKKTDDNNTTTGTGFL